MKNNFTTPAFAKVLKEHGIEIDTPFYWGTLMFYQETELFVKSGSYKTVQSISGNRYPKEALYDISQAYPLTEVLGWLPKTVTYKGSTWDIMPTLWNGAIELGLGQVEEDTFVLKYYLDEMPIEVLITQGLTEGWLTKEIILQTIKD
jgi:hypothetical protein